ASSVQDTAAALGAVTLVMAGLIALVQTDIKRVIAYSTMSQIGYMFLGVGLGAYASGMFHLMTHAFFKALLFLAAGIVLPALADAEDVRLLPGRRAVARRAAALLRFLLEGSDHRGGDRARRRVRLRHVRAGHRRDAPDRAVHVPARLPGLPRAPGRVRGRDV